MSILAKAAEPAEAPTPAPADVVVTDSDQYGEIHLDSMIALHGAGLRAWEEQTPKKDLEVYVDGILIPLPQSQILLSKLRDDWISVILTRDATDQASHDAWGPILERSMHYIGKTPHLVDVTLGRQGELPLPTKARLPMMIVDRTWFWFWLLGMAALAALLFWLGKESDLLRDQGPDPAGGRKPFSLARTQMAFWLFVVVASYLFILIVTGDTNTINDSVLGLMGIIAATGFGAVMVDASKTSATRAQRDAAQKTRSELQMKKTVAPLTPAEETQLATAIADVARRRLRLALPLTVALLTASCCSMKQQALIRKPQTLALMDRAKAESFNANQSAVQALQRGMSADYAKVSANPSAKPCAEQWTILSHRIDSFLDRWHTKKQSADASPGTGTLSPAFVDAAKEPIAGSFDAIR